MEIMQNFLPKIGRQIRLVMVIDGEQQCL